jgi:hypothetical protein
MLISNPGKTLPFLLTILLDQLSFQDFNMKLGFPRQKEEVMMARIREAEHGQLIAELTQKISALEYKVRKMSNSYKLFCHPSLR